MEDSRPRRQLQRKAGRRGNWLQRGKSFHGVIKELTHVIFHKQHVTELENMKDKNSEHNLGQTEKNKKAKTKNKIQIVVMTLRPLNVRNS